MYVESKMKWSQIKYLNDVAMQGVLTADRTYFYWRGTVVKDGKITSMTYRINRQSEYVEEWIS